MAALVIWTGGMWVHTAPVSANPSAAVTLRVSVAPAVSIDTAPGVVTLGTNVAPGAAASGNVQFTISANTSWQLKADANAVGTMSGPEGRTLQATVEWSGDSATWTPLAPNQTLASGSAGAGQSVSVPFRVMPGWSDAPGEYSLTFNVTVSVPI